MAKIIAFTNQAGGVGKSTSVVNIAAFLSKKYKFDFTILSPSSYCLCH